MVVMVAAPPTSTVLPKSTGRLPAVMVKLPATLEPAAIESVPPGFCAVMATLPRVVAALVSSVNPPETASVPLWVIAPGVETLSVPFTTLLVPRTNPPPLLAMVTLPAPPVVTDRLLAWVSIVMAPWLCSTRVPAAASTPALPLLMLPVGARKARVPPAV